MAKLDAGKLANVGFHRWMAVGIALIAAGCGGVTGNSIPSSSNAPGQLNSATTTVKPLSASGFRGIFEFAGDNSSADATKPDLAGVVLVYYWSQIEPEKGTFDWNAIDKDMAPWIAAGKKIILRISTSGAANWDPPYSGTGTPKWVFADGTKIVHDNGETLPVYWDNPYLTDYRSFVRAFGLHFDGNPHVEFVEPGIGMGGETLPETNPSAAGVAAWKAAGYTDALWLTTVKKMSLYFEASFKKIPIYPLIDRTFFDGNGAGFRAVMSWFRTRPHWGLQDDGLSSRQKLNSDWSGPPLALEQLTPTRISGDCLCTDISNGLDNLHGKYLLLFRSDIDNPASAEYLKQAAHKETSGG